MQLCAGSRQRLSRVVHGDSCATRAWGVSVAGCVCWAKMHVGLARASLRPVPRYFHFVVHVSEHLGGSISVSLFLFLASRTFLVPISDREFLLLSIQSQEGRLRPSIVTESVPPPHELFASARAEGRVILTASPALVARAACPEALLLDPNQLELALVIISREFKFSFSEKRFLSVCGKCGGKVQAIDRSDPRIGEQSRPEDTQLYLCTICWQRYYFNGAPLPSCAVSFFFSAALPHIS